MHVSLTTPAPSPAGAGCAWVDRLGAALDAHVLIIGDGTLDLICAMIRRGCPGASALHSDDRVIAESVETVLVPRVASRSEADRAIALAIRALLPSGRIYLRLTPDLVYDVERLLLARGFSAVRREPSAEMLLVSGELPIFGVHAWAAERATHV